MKNYRLKSGFEMPALGLGTWRLSGEQCRKVILEALDIGYRHIDTAAAYGNEDAIGKALRSSDLKRTEIFLTSKVWFDNLESKQVTESCTESLKQLQTDYLDLFLIHWPNSRIPLRETFRGLEHLAEKKLIRSFGVSNFSKDLLNEAMQSTSLPLCVNQVEFHPFLNQADLLAFCKEHQMTLTAYSPVARGHVVQEPVLNKIAEKHNCTPVQVSLAWLLQKDIAAIPKASSRKHLKENFEAANVTLDDEDMKSIEDLNRNQRLVNPSWARF